MSSKIDEGRGVTTVVRLTAEKLSRPSALRIVEGRFALIYFYGGGVVWDDSGFIGMVVGSAYNDPQPLIYSLVVDIVELLPSD